MQERAFSVRRDRTDQQPGYKMVALRVRDQCMRRVELIPVGMCTRTARASPLKAFGHPERIVGGGDDMFRNCCTTVPDWFRRDVAGDAGCALRGVVARTASAPLSRGSGARGTRPEGSHHGAWGRPFHRESAAPGVTSSERRGTSITHNFLGPCQEISPMLRYVDDRFIQTVHSFSRGLRGASCG